MAVYTKIDNNDDIEQEIFAVQRKLEKGDPEQE